MLRTPTVTSLYSHINLHNYVSNACCLAVGIGATNDTIATGTLVPLSMVPQASNELLLSCRSPSSFARLGDICMGEQVQVYTQPSPSPPATDDQLKHACLTPKQQRSRQQVHCNACMQWWAKHAVHACCGPGRNAPGVCLHRLHGLPNG